MNEFKAYTKTLGPLPSHAVPGLHLGLMPAASRRKTEMRGLGEIKLYIFKLVQITDAIEHGVLYISGRIEGEIERDAKDIEFEIGTQHFILAEVERN